MSSRDIVMTSAGVPTGPKINIDDVFSTYVYTGHEPSQIISNSIAFSDKAIATSLNTSASSQRGDSTINSYFTESWGIFGDYHLGQYLQVDFGEPVEVTKVSYRNGPGGQWAPPYVQIWKSSDGTNWTSIYDYNDNNTSNLQTITFSTHVARYWRLYQNSNTRGGSNGYEWHISNFSMEATLQTSIAKGGMVWIKSRSSAEMPWIFDTARGESGNSWISPTSSSTFSFPGYGVNSFNSNGFTLNGGSGYAVNTNSTNYVSWSFAKSAKFFDMITYTGDGVADRLLNHNLGVQPGMIIIKAISASSDWTVATLSSGTSYYWNGKLNSTAAFSSSPYDFGSGMSSTKLNTYIGNSVNETNASGVNYIAYVFAHDTTSDGMIRCGTYNSLSEVNLGWEPQYVMIKTITSGSSWSDWYIMDNMRGLSAKESADLTLQANISNAEGYQSGWMTVTSTGFKPTYVESGKSYMYMAIRRPMKVPTDGTKVFMPDAYAEVTNPPGIGKRTYGFAPDMVMQTRFSGGYSYFVWDKLRGLNKELVTATNASEGGWSSYPWGGFDSTGVTPGFLFNNAGSDSSEILAFKRAPSFFDIVCYAGDGIPGSAKQHSLGVPPELLIIKQRSNPDGWKTYCALSGPSNTFELQTSNGASSSGWFNNATPTATYFYTQGGGTGVNSSGEKYVALLFASCPGVSKIGTFTGNGGSQAINCGFTTGARFVMIKRTDTTGNWYNWNTSRGIVAGNDPYMTFNTTGAKVTTDDSIDPYSLGFIVNQTSDTNVNVTSATYIYLAIS